mgnify:CR=1 FL=1
MQADDFCRLSGACAGLLCVYRLQKILNRVIPECRIIMHRFDIDEDAMLLSLAVLWDMHCSIWHKQRS